MNTDELLQQVSVKLEEMTERFRAAYQRGAPS
jgi:hypothetical protein